MLLKSLELQGFKSFADKTVLDLSSKITSIVGPNGSGKSNITDAIRWLLGERDARNLRGGKIEDLIFAGTEKKPRMGMAQATLYFDNSSKFFPVDFDEVSISRRVSRDGESTFFLNKAEVRLKDVVDFFAKSKLGARGLTIITQGSSDMFLRAAPVERKEMIEEVLGLKEYQLKKTESIRKLKSTAVNLETVNASLVELKPHLRFLKRQVARYEERDSMVLELKKLEDNFYGRKFKFLKAELINWKAQLERIDKLAGEEEKIYKEAEAKIKEIKEKEAGSANSGPNFKELEAKKNGLLGEKADLQRELGKLEARIEFEAEATETKDIDSVKILRELKSLAESVAGETDIAKLQAAVSLMLQKINEAFGDVPRKAAKAVSPEIMEAQERLVSNLNKLDEAIKVLVSEEEQIRKSLADYNKVFTASYEEFEAEKQKFNSLISDKNRLNFDIEKTELKISNLKEEMMQAGRSLESLENVVLEEMSGSLSGVATDEEITRRMFKLRGDLAGIGDIDQNLVKEAKETEERFNFLTQQVADLDSAARDLKVLIRDLDQKIHRDFTEAIKIINDEFGKLMKLMFGGGSAKLVVNAAEPKGFVEEENEEENKAKANIDADPELEDKEDIAQGIEIEVSLPKKRIKGLDVLSGGERTLVSIAVLFALISVSPPPFLVLDEVDAALDEGNARRCSEILKEFSKKSQFVIVTHNRATMEAASVLYGVTMQEDGTSKLLSLKFEEAAKP